MTLNNQPDTLNGEVAHEAAEGDISDTLASRRIACVECRQQKVKCDAQQHWPDSCSRCKRRRLNCVLQRDFKRTSKRKRIEEMEQEMETLRRTLREASNGVESPASELNSTRGSMNSSANSAVNSGAHTTSNVSNHPISIPGGTGPHTSPVNRTHIGIHAMVEQNSPRPIHAHNPSSLEAAGTLTSINGITRQYPHQQQQQQHLYQHPQIPQPNQHTNIAISQGSSASYPNSKINGNGPGLPSPVFTLNNHVDTNGSPTIQTPHSTTSSTENSNAGGHICPRPFPLPEIETYECTEKTVDDFKLQPDIISVLYHEFAVHYHPYLPVVDINMGPEKMYSLSPPLFWTIMNVGSRRYRDGQLNLKLNDILKTILSELAILPVTRFASSAPGSPGFNVATAYGVQSFLLATFWPLPTSSLTADISFSCAGTAIISATRGGLHCPEYARDFARVKLDNPIFPKINEQIRTWVTCNICEQLVAAMFGLPSFTIFDSVVLSACSADSEIDLPITLRYLLQIQHIEHEIELSLNTNTKDPLGLVNISERLSLIQLLSNKLNELDILEERAPEKVPVICRLSLRVTRLHLMTYYLLDTEEFTSLYLQKGIIQAYNSALSVLAFVDTVCRTRDKDFPKYLPTVFVLSLWQASSMVNKLYHSEFSQYLDTKTGKSLYNSTIGHVMRASLLKHDILFRAAEMMKQNWNVFEHLVEKYGGHYSAKVKIKSRRAASVFFDTLWTVREEAGIRSQAHPVLFERAASDEGEGADDDDNNNNNERLNTGATPGRAPTPIAVKQDEALHIGKQIPTSNERSASQNGPSETVVAPSNEFAGNEWNDPETLWRDVDSLMFDLGFQHESLNLGMP